MNVPLSLDGSIVQSAPVTIAPTVEVQGHDLKIPVLAPDIVMADTKQADKFGVEAVPVELKPGVEVHSMTIVKHFAPSAFNQDHAKLIARSEKAQGMAINMYSGWWSLVISIVTTVLVSLVTKPKPESELKNLVMGLTEIPDEGPCPWYQSPKLWVTFVAVVLVAVNIIVW
ncbi:MAG TPA: hypothetical protein VMQ67_04180 [Candidatus Saccharimonadales bacterium]|nr:hypothetical protein [Candidatus Saccharimonadales bacterium]